MKSGNRKIILSLEKQLKDTLAMAESRQLRLEEFENSIKLENIVEEISDLLFSPDAKPTDKHFNRLRQAFLRTYPSFIEALDKMNLTQRDYRDALLIRINVPLKVCADCFHISKQAISNSRSRLFKDIKDRADVKNWVEYIKSL